MTKLISKEQFQERLDSKHESLIAQRTQRVEEEISSILKGVALKDLSDEQQYTILKSAKYIAENKNYSEDYKLKILENIKNSAEENNYGEKINQDEGLNIFSDISDDIVYQRIIEKGDMENAKLFLERKLPFDVYCKYLFLGKQLKDAVKNTADDRDENGELQTIEEAEESSIENGNSTGEKKLQGKSVEDTALATMLNELQKYTTGKKDFIKKIKRVKKAGSYKEGDFDKFGVFGSDFYEILKKYGIEKQTNENEGKKRKNKVKIIDNNTSGDTEKVELLSSDLKNYLNSIFTKGTLLKKYKNVVKYNEKYYTNFPKNIIELKRFFEAKDDENLLDIIFGNDELSDNTQNIHYEDSSLVDIFGIDDSEEIGDISIEGMRRVKEQAQATGEALKETLGIDEKINEYIQKFLKMRQISWSSNVIPAGNGEKRQEYLRSKGYYLLQNEIFELEKQYPYLSDLRLELAKQLKTGKRN